MGKVGVNYIKKEIDNFKIVAAQLQFEGMSLNKTLDTLAAHLFAKLTRGINVKQFEVDNE